MSSLLKAKTDWAAMQSAKQRGEVVPDHLYREYMEYYMSYIFSVFDIVQEQLHEGVAAKKDREMLQELIDRDLEEAACGGARRGQAK